MAMFITHLYGDISLLIPNLHFAGSPMEINNDRSLKDVFANVRTKMKS